MIIYYRERTLLGDFKCIDKVKSFRAMNYYIPTGSSLYYFKVDRFNTRVISFDDLIRIEEV